MDPEDSSELDYEYLNMMTLPDKKNKKKKNSNSGAMTPQKMRIKGGSLKALVSNLNRGAGTENYDETYNSSMSIAIEQKSIRHNSYQKIDGQHNFQNLQSNCEMSQNVMTDFNEDEGSESGEYPQQVHNQQHYEQSPNQNDRENMLISKRNNGWNAAKSFQNN